MTSLKLGSSISPQIPSFRPAVERPVTAPRAEVATPSPAVSRDEFVSGSASPQRSAASTEDVFEGAPVREPTERQLSEALEPFREALDQIIDQVRQDPSLLLNPSFLAESVGKLGIAAKDFAEAIEYVRMGPIVQNTGRDRVA